MEWRYEKFQDKEKVGVYSIENQMNGKRYIGSSFDIRQRFWDHRCGLRKNKHGNQHLQSSWNKYGGDNFEFSILQECDTDDMDVLIGIEQNWIDHYEANNREFGYNMRKVAGSCLGMKASPEKIAKMSKMFSGSGNPFYGKHHTEKSKRRMSESTKKQRLSDEHKEKIRQAMTGEKNHRYGKPLSDEVKKKISDAKKGTKASQETKDKMSLDRRGKNNPNYRHGRRCNTNI